MDSSWVCQRCGATVTCAAMDVLICPMCRTPKGGIAEGRRIMVTEQGFVCSMNEEGAAKLFRVLGFVSGDPLLEFYDKLGHRSVTLSLSEIAQFADEWRGRHGMR